MKKFLFLLIFISGYCYSQEPVFNLEKNKAYKISMKGLSDHNKADYITRTVEKMQMAIFAFADPVTETGYFIVDNFYKVHEIEKIIDNENGFHYIGYEEVDLTEDAFFEMYMQRGGFEKGEFSTNPPKKVIMGPYNKLTNDLYNKAVEIWDKKFKK
jgi:hypothetical protein